MMVDKATDDPKGMPEVGLGGGRREFKLWMTPAGRGLSHAELYSLIAGGYDCYGVIPIRRPLTAKEQLSPNVPAGAQAIVEPVLVFVGPVDAPEIVLETPRPGLAD